MRRRGRAIIIVAFTLGTVAAAAQQPPQLTPPAPVGRVMLQPAAQPMFKLTAL